MLKRLSHFALAMLVSAATLAGPATWADDRAQVVQVGGGKTLVVSATDGAELSITFKRVVSDERCPTTVTCAWARPPFAEFDLVSLVGGQRQTYALTLEAGRFATLTGWQLTFVDLQPAPKDPQSFARIAPLATYTATLAATRAGK